MAGYNGGYGLYVKLQHTHDVATAYAHMSRLGPGIKPGVSVRQGQVIGFVGSTGMSTGPHLHYEFHRGGRAVNPLAQKFAMRAAVGGKDLARFQALARQYLDQMKNAPAVGRRARPSRRSSQDVAGPEGACDAPGRAAATSASIGRRQSAASPSTRWPAIVSSPFSTPTSTVSPSLMRPSSSSVASGFCRLRWMTRFSGRAP